MRCGAVRPPGCHRAIVSRGFIYALARGSTAGDNDCVDLVAHASVVICASRSTVWRALLAPETIPKIMPVVEVVAAWRLGESFVWSFELAGRESRVEGRVTRVEEERLLEYDYADPHSRDILGKDTLHRVTIKLTGGDGGTRVAVTQDGNLSTTAHAHAEGGWRLALNHLKGLVERAPTP